MHKIKIYSEAVYVFAILVLSFSVAMITAAEFGVSMIVAPAYILSEKVSFLTFGQSEYVIQSLLFIVFCIIMGKVKAVYFSSFATCIFYGAVLDLWRLVVPIFNPSVTEPGSMAMWIRIVFFVLGTLLTAFSVALFYKTYLYPQVYDFFVKGVSRRFGKDTTKFKIAFDASSLVLSIVMTLVLFGKFVGIGWGTLVMTALNGVLIGFFGKLFDKYFEFEPYFKKFASHFEL